MQTKILMVCLGNICRSPLAEGILASKVDKQKVFTDSAGTSNWHIGKAPDSRSIAIAKEFGIDISQQKARQFTTKDFETFDRIYVMDTNNYQDVLALAKTDSEREKVSLVLDSLAKGENLEVPDPYYGGEQGFLEVYKMLDQALESIAKDLSK